MILTRFGRRAIYANPSSAGTEDRCARSAFDAVPKLGEPRSVTLVSASELFRAYV